MRLVDIMIGAAVAVLLTGCAGVADGSAAEPSTAAGQGAAAPAPAPSTPAKPGAAPGGTQATAEPAGGPAPDVRIPADPAKLAGALKKTTTELDAAIDAWTASGQARPPRRVELLALHQQRIYRAMARSTALADRTIARLPKGLAGEARDHTTAVAKLLSMARPISAERRKKMRLAEPLPAERLRGHMLRAEKRFGVEWEVLAAIILVETKFGRVKSASSSGAQGPMQFMPGTWRLYGMGGDVHDARDAILAAANYLKATGAPRDYRRAVFAYNHDTRYVDAVLTHARQIKRDPRTYYAYYNWQVFVLSTKGDVRLTGPR
jgi:membrane-bound lytic murein transglycosylase B